MKASKAKSIISKNLKKMEVTEPFQKMMVDTKSSTVRPNLSVDLISSKYKSENDAATETPKDKTKTKITVKVVKSKDKGVDEIGGNKKRTVIINDNGIVGMQG